MRSHEPLLHRICSFNQIEVDEDILLVTNDHLNDTTSIESIPFPSSTPALTKYLTMPLAYGSGSTAASACTLPGSKTIAQPNRVMIQPINGSIFNTAASALLVMAPIYPPLLGLRYSWGEEEGAVSREFASNEDIDTVFKLNTLALMVVTTFKF